jgi:hypothetical protein
MPILDLERRNHHLRRFLVEHELEPTDVTAVGFVASRAGVDRIVANLRSAGGAAPGHRLQEATTRLSLAMFDPGGQS